MESSGSPPVLVVSAQTAATPALLEAVRERAARGPASFTLLVPNAAHGLRRVIDPEDQEHSEADQMIGLADAAARGRRPGRTSTAWWASPTRSTRFRTR